MALKDLVADRTKITEETIEGIVADYVRYDPIAYEVVLTPAGGALGNEAKVLVILVALMGWKYVVDEVRTVDTKPAALEEMTGIHGGTLRPVLKKLKDAHLLSSEDGRYLVRAANLNAIKLVVDGEKISVSTKRKNRDVKAVENKSLAKSPREVEGASDDVKVLTRNIRRKASVPVRASLLRLLEAGFFLETRTLRQVVVRLHEMAVIAKNTSLSGPIADLVREGRLERKKVPEGSKVMWGYRAA